MAINATAIGEAVVPVPIEVMGERGTVKIKLAAYQDALRLGTIAEFFAAAVAEWDVVYGKGEPVPLTVEAIRAHLIVPLQRAIYEQVLAFTLPNESVS